jgi:hypothetical protein
MHSSEHATTRWVGPVTSRTPKARSNRRATSGRSPKWPARASSGRPTIHWSNASERRIQPLLLRLGNAGTAQRHRRESMARRALVRVARHEALAAVSGVPLHVARPKQTSASAAGPGSAQSSAGSWLQAPKAHRSFSLQSLSREHWRSPGKQAPISQKPGPPQSASSRHARAPARQRPKAQRASWPQASSVAHWRAPSVQWPSTQRWALAQSASSLQSRAPETQLPKVQRDCAWQSSSALHSLGPWAQRPSTQRAAGPHSASEPQSDVPSAQRPREHRQRSGQSSSMEHSSTPLTQRRNRQRDPFAQSACRAQLLLPSRQDPRTQRVPLQQSESTSHWIGPSRHTPSPQLCPFAQLPSLVHWRSPLTQLPSSQRLLAPHSVSTRQSRDPSTQLPSTQRSAGRHSSSAAHVFGGPAPGAGTGRREEAARGLRSPASVARGSGARPTDSALGASRPMVTRGSNVERPGSTDPWGGRGRETVYPATPPSTEVAAMPDAMSQRRRMSRVSCVIYCSRDEAQLGMIHARCILPCAARGKVRWQVGETRAAA